MIEIPIPEPKPKQVVMPIHRGVYTLLCEHSIDWIMEGLSRYDSKQGSYEEEKDALYMYRLIFGIWITMSRRGEAEGFYHNRAIALDKRNQLKRKLGYT